MIHKINQEIREQIFVVDSDSNAVTGLIDSDFNKSLLKNQTITTETLNITEKGAGYYYIYFIPEDTGYYEWKVTHDIYEPFGWYDYYNIKNYNTDDLYTQIDTNTTTITDNNDTNTNTIISDASNNTTTITTNTDNKISNLQSVMTGSFASQEVLLSRALGLMQENMYIDNPVYSVEANLLSSRIRTYSDPNSVGSGSNILATYTATATYDENSNLETYKVIKE